MVEKPQSVKIALLGDSGVGKTCIINRYMSGQFTNNCASTIGGSYQQKIVKKRNKTLQLDIWDTAGQEKYRSLGKHFYKDAYIIILVYDICVKESFENLRSVWYEDIKKQGEKYTVLAIVGNKSDLFENEEVKEDEARKFADEIKATFMLVSAQNGDNIENLFNSVVDIYLGPEFQIKANEMINEKQETAKGNTKLQTNKGEEKNEKNFSCC